MGNYTPQYDATDASEVVTDGAVESGIQFKLFLPLFILGVVIVALLGMWYKIKHKAR